jgi:hypothetical protein
MGRLRIGVPLEITEEIEKRANAPEGFSIRIRHKFKRNGKPCSINKDAACQLTRKYDGWYYHCHRCMAAGFISDGNRSPSTVMKAIDKLKEPTNQIIANISLPSDFTPMKGKRKDNVPWAAYHWLWGNKLIEDDFKKFNIGWSNIYQRIIFPCYATAYLLPSESRATKLLGWIGREPFYSSKKTRPANIPKYLTKRAEGLKWLHYHVPTKSSENIVLVEDCVSAIRVSNATRWHGLAMLTTHIPARLLISLKNMNVWVWLDADAMSQAVKRTASLRALGLNAKFVHTLRDPKHYDNLAIYKILNSEGGLYNE